MSKQLDYFKFEVRPFNYAGIHGGQEKIYEVRVQVDGKEYDVTRVPHEVPVSVSELRYLMQNAINTLEKIVEGEETDE